jgi:hypothetical protein
VRRPEQYGAFANKATRLTTLREHEELFDLIAAGDAPGAERAAREHFSEAHHEPDDWHHAFDYQTRVDASVLRNAEFRVPRAADAVPKPPRPVKRSA